MVDDKLEADELRRIGQHGDMKARVEDDVGAELASRAAPASVWERRRIDQVAGRFRERAVDEVIDTEREIDRSRVAARISQVVDYVFFVLYALLGLRFVLAFAGARGGSGFVRFIVAATDPFYAPFRGILATPTVGMGHVLMLSLIVAIVAYALLHLAINGLLRMVAHRKTAV